MTTEPREMRSEAEKILIENTRLKEKLDKLESDAIASKKKYEDQIAAIETENLNKDRQHEKDLRATRTENLALNEKVQRERDWLVEEKKLHENREVEYQRVLAKCRTLEAEMHVVRTEGQWKLSKLKIAEGRIKSLEKNCARKETERRNAEDRARRAETNYRQMKTVVHVRSAVVYGESQIEAFRLHGNRNRRKNWDYTLRQGGDWRVQQFLAQRPNALDNLPFNRISEIVVGIVDQCNAMVHSDSKFGYRLFGPFRAGMTIESSAFFETFPVANYNRYLPPTTVSRSDCVLMARKMAHYIGSVPDVN